MLRLHVFKIRWTQHVRKQISQDDSEYLGTQRVESRDVNVIANSQYAAEAALREQNSHLSIEIVDHFEEPIHIFVPESRVISAMAVSTRLEPIEKVG